MNFSPLNAIRTAFYRNGPLPDVERAQPTELQPVGTHQVSHSANPPLSPQQTQQLARRLSGMEHYERALPELRELRQAARALDARAHHLPPVDVAKQRMALEGALLHANPNLDFSMATELLDMGQAQGSSPRVPVADVSQLCTQLLALATQPEGERPTHEAVRAMLDKGLSDMAKHLEGHEAFYHQALQGPLTDTERTRIKAGHRALAEMADTWKGTVALMLQSTLTLVEERLETAQAALKPLQAQAPKHYDEAQEELRAQQQVQGWQSLQAHLTKILASPNPVDKAAQGVQLDNHVAALDARRKGWVSQFTTAAAEGIAQGMASSALFLLARAYVDPRLTVFSLIGQSMANGAAMGAVHETLDNFVKPATREVLASVGMREAEEVPVDSLILDATRATVVNGRYHERSDNELAAEQALVEQARAGFLNNQKDYKTGTMRGDALTYLNQPMAQMVRQLLSVTTSLNTGSVPARAVTSFAGGVGMSGSQALGKLNKTYHHNGRHLPTHVPKAAPDDSLAQRLIKTGRKAAPTVDPRQGEARENYASKIWSAAEGMLGYNAIGRAMGTLDTTTRSGAAGSVVLANLQAIALLLPFYANKQSGSEAKADGGSRVTSAVANALTPDRDSLDHGTQPGTVARGAENLYNRMRGATQLGPQMATLLTEAAIGTTVRFGHALSATENRPTATLPVVQPVAIAAPNPPYLSLGNLDATLDVDAMLAALDEPQPVPPSYAPGPSRRRE
jgi:effector protein HopM1